MRKHAADVPAVASEDAAPADDAAEVIRLGTEIFERDVRPTLPPDPPNDHIVIDVDERTWAIDADPVVCLDEMNRRTGGRLFSRRLVTPYTSRRR